MTMKNSIFLVIHPIFAKLSQVTHYQKIFAILAYGHYGHHLGYHGNQKYTKSDILTWHHLGYKVT